MQEFVTNEEPSKSLKIGSLPFDERQRLIDVFAWLIKEDKKQNPAFYKLKKEKQND